MRALLWGCSLLVLLLAGRAAAASLDAQQWREYRQQLITSDGRVVDNANGFISHSEGQGYGMLLAVAANDRATFDKLWNWTRKNLGVRNDGLFAWRWQSDANPHVTDNNNATDGDLLIAWALGRASERFHQPAYADDARHIASAIRKQLLYDTNFGSLLLPGRSGFEVDKGVIVNPSYLIFPAFKELNRWDPSPQWQALEQGGRTLLRALLKQYDGLPPDWIEVDDNNKIHAAEKFPLRFGFDALRVPLYCYWSGDEDLVDVPRIEAVWQRDDAPAWIALDSSEHAKNMPLSSAHRAVRHLLRNIIAERQHDIAEPDLALPDDYYGATLTLLTELAWKERHD